MKVSGRTASLIRNFNVKSHFGRQVLATIPSCLISICSGMMFGVTSMMLPQLRQDKNIYYVPSHKSWIASITSISMVLGSLSSGQILDKYGTKIAHVIVGIPYIMSWIAIACAPSTAIIILGRFLGGLSSGSNKPVMLCYISELASPKIRTLATIIPSVMLNIGILVSHILTYYLNWRLSSFICLIPAMLIPITSLFLKESPLWLISKGRIDEGIEVFRWFRGTDEAAEGELKTVLDRQTNETKISRKETFKLICSSSFIKPMLTLLVIVVNMQLSGFGVLSIYSYDIFQQTFSGDVEPFSVIISMDCILGFMSVAVCLLGKYISKKKCYLISNFGIMVFISGLVACLIVGYDGFTWLPVACLIIYFICSATVFTVGWTYIPELLPSTVRGLGSSVTITFAWITLFTTVQVIPDIMKVYGPVTLFTIFGISTFVCEIILPFILPDTDGKTLQSIEDSYKQKKIEITSI